MHTTLPQLTFKCVNDGMFNNNNYGIRYFLLKEKRNLGTHNCKKEKMKMTLFTTTIILAKWEIEAESP